MQTFKEFAKNQMRAKITDTPSLYGPGIDSKWRDIMTRLAGQWVDIETNHLFGDSFNARDPEGGIFHLAIKHVQDIQNDVRPQAAKCGWCGKTFLNVPDNSLGNPCPKCAAWPMQELAVVDRIRPLVTVHDGKAEIVYSKQRLKKVKTPEGDVFRPVR